MTTIPQRLRAIAGDLNKSICRQQASMSAGELLSIAAELEVPAADAVPVATRIQFVGENSMTPVVRQRDHLATVSALQARINELESTRITDSEMPAYGPIQWEALIEAVCEAMTGNPKVGWERDPSYYVGHQPVDINMNSLNRIVSKFVASAQARIKELESRQEQVRAFLDIAAGEGMELGGVDAGDLYVKMFGYPHPDTSKEQP